MKIKENIYDTNKMRIILASNSPRRKELLKLLNINFEVIVSGIDENIENDLSIEEKIKHLSYLKAKSVFDRTTGNRIVIGSDTMVIKEDNVFGKPQDRQDAINMIKMLKNDVHQVITGIAILIQKGDEYKEYLDFDTANIFVKDLSDEEILNWLNTGKYVDKAGAYAIEEEFAVFIEKIDGNYSTIVGLPIHKVYDILKSYI